MNDVSIPGSSEARHTVHICMAQADRQAGINRSSKPALSFPYALLPATRHASSNHIQLPYTHLQLFRPNPLLYHPQSSLFLLADPITYMGGQCFNSLRHLRHPLRHMHFRLRRSISSWGSTSLTIPSCLNTCVTVPRDMSVPMLGTRANEPCHWLNDK
jgi:hypothetical protein